MANRCKVGLDYFPFDAAFFEDDKIQLIHAEYGAKGVIVAIKLLCKIYKEGYYYKWGDDECLLFTKNAGVEFTHGFVKEVVSGLVRRRFFDKGCLDSFGILTSPGIQKRYFDATIRYKKIEIISEYLLIKPPERNNVIIIKINVDINPENANTNQHSNRNNNESNNKKENEIDPPPVTELPTDDLPEEDPQTDPVTEEPAYPFEGRFQQARSPAPKIEEVQYFFLNNGQTTELANKFFNRYDATNWMISGSAITNWRAVANNWLADPNKFNSPAGSSQQTKSKLEENIDANLTAKELNRRYHDSNNQNN